MLIRWVSPGLSSWHCCGTMVQNEDAERYHESGGIMQRIRDRIEKALASFGHLVFRNRLKALFVMLLIIAGLVSQLPKIRIDTSTEGFLHESDPALVDYNAFREQFGRDELVIIAIKPPDVLASAPATASAASAPEGGSTGQIPPRRPRPRRRHRATRPAGRRSHTAPLPPRRGRW